MLTLFQRVDYWKVIFLIFPLAAFLAFSKAVEPPYDFWEHAASVRALAQNLPSPSNPFLQLPGFTSPRFVPYTVLLGAIAKLTHLDIFTLMAWAAVANYLLFVIGLYWFIRTLYNDPKMPLYVLLTCWLFWGKSRDFSNGYQLETFLIGLTDPYMFSYALSFFALYFLVLFLRAGKWKALAGAVLLIGIDFVNHPPTAAFCLIFGFAIVVTAEKKFIGRGAVGLALAAVAVVAAGWSWPYFSYYKTFFHGLRDAWFGVRLYSDFLSALGPALVGIPLLILQFLKKQHRFILVGFLLNLAMFAAGYYAEIDMGERFIFFVAFFLHLAIASYVREKAPFHWQSLKQWLAQIRANPNGRLAEEKFLISLALAVLIVFALFFRAQALSLHLSRVLDFRPSPGLHAYESPVGKYLVLDQYIDSSAVVLADLLTSWMVPAITGAKVVAVYHNNPLLGTENIIRAAAVQAYFDSTTSLSQRRAILRTYRVSHLVLNFDFVPLKKNQAAALMQGLGNLLAETNGMLIYKISADLAGEPTAVGRNLIGAAQKD